MDELGGLVVVMGFWTIALGVSTFLLARRLKRDEELIALYESLLLAREKLNIALEKKCRALEEMVVAQKIYISNLKMKAERMEDDGK